MLNKSVNPIVSKKIILIILISICFSILVADISSPEAPVKIEISVSKDKVYVGDIWKLLNWEPIKTSVMFSKEGTYELVVERIKSSIEKFDAYQVEEKRYFVVGAKEDKVCRTKELCVGGTNE